MRICFIPFPIIVESPEINDRKQLYPYVPLGILTLSALLEQAGHEVSICDLAWKTVTNSEEITDFLNPETVAQLILAKKPDMVGFSTIFSSYPLVIRWAESFHKISPHTPIVLGGPQASTADEPTLQAFPWIDMILRGEAENSIIPLVTCLEQGSGLASVQGLTWRDGDRIIRNPDASIVTDLDNLPVPAYHLYPVDTLSQYYKNKAGLYHHNFPIEAGRGCPFNCSFCSTSGYFQRRYRTKSPDRLIHEMVTLHAQYGLDHFDLSHDLFTANKTFLLEFCRRLQAKGLQEPIKWECYSRIDTVDRQVLTKMATAGCSGIFYGVETGSQRMQNLIGKNLPVNRVKSIVEETLALGINVSISFICGFPQEQKEDLSATFALAVDMINLGVDQIVLLPLFPLLSSQLYQQFGETLHFDGPWSSDILYGCLSPDDREQILKWPRIFPGFYHYETPGLDSDMLRSLLRIINRYPRLPAILNLNGIEVMQVFETWPEWLRTHVTLRPENYYLQQSFFADFFQFMQENLTGNPQMTSQLVDLVHYYAVIARVYLNTEESPITAERFNSDVLELMSRFLRKEALAGDLLQPAAFLFWKYQGKVITKRLTPALAGLLGITV
jgi:radical SAM superfamily enzyme YgiQ (UPF0313 family)